MTDGHLVHPQVVIHVASDGIDGIVIAQVVDVDGADTEAGVTESGVHRGRRNGDADDCRLAPAALAAAAGQGSRASVDVAGGSGRFDARVGVLLQLAVLLGQQGSHRAGKYVPRTGGAQPRRGRTRYQGDDATVFMIANDEGDRTLEHHGGPGDLVGTLRPGPGIGQHIGRRQGLAAQGEQCGQLTGMGVMTTWGGTREGSMSSAPASTQIGGMA